MSPEIRPMHYSDRAAIECAARLAAGGADPTTLHWLHEGFKAWARCGGAIPLERCLHLPATPTRRRLLRRNVWVQIASNMIDAPGAFANATLLAAELDQFIARGPWLTWRGFENPPADASDLRTALFHIAKTNNGEPLSAKQLHRVLGQFSP